MLKCAVCGYENKEGAQYCLNCGSPLTTEKVSQPVDDVSEEKTVLLDPGAMQARIQDEIRRQRESSGQTGKPETPPAAPLTPPAALPPPPRHPATPPPSPAARPAPPAPVQVSTPSPAIAPAAPTPVPAALPSPAPSAAGEPKKWLIAFVVAIFLGPLGIHRFYVGKIGTGVAMLVTGGGCGVWWLIDVIMIALDKFKDAQGRDLVK